MQPDATGSQIAEPVHDVTRVRAQPLAAIFEPKTVAVIGATERDASVGRRVFENLVTGTFAGEVFPVNPAHAAIFGKTAYPSVGAVPARIDVAIIVTPAAGVPAVVEECVGAGVRGAIIISAGFREVGAAGAQLEQQILATVRASGMRVVGPNCFGVMSPGIGFNATFARAPARPGTLGFASQSGALGSAILDWSLDQDFGFSRFVSVGSMLDVGWADILYYLGDDPQTKSIIAYMESVGDARSFMSAAREVALVKPIIVIKAGRSDAGAKAAASHTGALTGSDAVLDAAFARCGVLRVDTIEDVFLMSEVLARQPRPRGKRLAILTNAGGPAVLAADALVQGGGEMAVLGAATMARLSSFLPPAWSHGDPVDILGDADGERYASAMAAVSADDASDGVLVIFAPQGISDSDDIAARLAPFARVPNKPVLASWLGGAGSSAGDQRLRKEGIPTVPYPDAASRLFNYMWRYDDALRSLYETPVEQEEAGIDRARAKEIIASATGAGRTLLAEIEAKSLFAAYGIPTVPTLLAASAQDAVRAARSLGFPVAVKLHSHVLTHKSDVGGVVLDVAHDADVVAAFTRIEQAARKAGGAAAFEGVTVQPMITREGYELIVGSSVDAQFGPVLLFGLGGTLVEVFQDSALGLPPLTSTLARQLMERTKIFRALEGLRGRAPVDIAALERVLVNVSRLVGEQRRVKELDINPLLASPSGLVALDARVVLHDASVPDSALPKAAIRPYPRQYEGRWSAADGTGFTIRPIRPDDETLLQRFHETLSESSVYRRYAHVVRLDQRVSHSHLIRSCFIDYDREMALVALPEAGGPAIVAVGRLIKSHEGDEAEFALVVTDEVQRHGLGRELLRRLIDVGRAEGVGRIVGHILADNSAMLHVCKELGFTTAFEADASMLDAYIDL